MIATGTALAIGALASAGGQVAAGKMASNANKSAANAQLQSNREALDFEKQVYADRQKSFAPYMAQNERVASRLGDLLAQPRQAPTAESVFAGGQAPSPGQPASIGQLRMPVGGGQQPAASATNGLVRMQAPDGEIRMVRPDAVARYEGKGIRRL